MDAVGDLAVSASLALEKNGVLQNVKALLLEGIYKALNNEVCLQL